MYFSESVCVIHFEGKDEELKCFTKETLAKVLETREEWLSLPFAYKNLTEVAKKSFRKCFRRFIRFFRNMGTKSAPSDELRQGLYVTMVSCATGMVFKNV